MNKMEIIFNVDGWELQNDDDGYRWVNPNNGINGVSSHHSDIESALSDFEDMLEQRERTVKVVMKNRGGEADCLEALCVLREWGVMDSGIDDEIEKSILSLNKKEEVKPMDKFKVKFIEETCHTYEVEAGDKAEAKILAEAEYYGYDDAEENKDRVKFICKEPEANELISCEVVDE